jgi:hypothetical protein
MIVLIFPRGSLRSWQEERAPKRAMSGIPGTRDVPREKKGDSTCKWPGIQV